MITSNVPVVRIKGPLFGLSYGSPIRSGYAVEGETVLKILSFDSTFYKVNASSLTVTSFTIPVYCVVSSCLRVFWFRRSFSGRVFLSFEKPTSIRYVPTLEDCHD